MRTMDHQMHDGWDREPEQFNEQSQDTGRGMGRSGYREMPVAPPSSPQKPEDLTLGMTALLGIFVVAVLICAVVFGFGYSTGRTLHGKKPDQPVAATAPAAALPGNPAASATPPLATVQPAAKPSAGAPLAATDPLAAASSTDEPGGFPPPAQAAANAGSANEGDEDAPSGRMARAAAPTASPMEAGGIMVQIAAVARQADAELLAQALRSNGYPAHVRTEPQDNYLHVQIGPFATRDQAKAMRTRLQAAGYNAFLKQ